MTKNTMGSFISALRKANGLTQKELAEKLNVSDKAVSRWERDETCPDLTLIPLIAETFGITSDELLKGEKSKASDSETAEPKTSRASGKKIDTHVKRLFTKFKNRSLISISIAALLSFIALMIFIFLPYVSDISMGNPSVLYFLLFSITLLGVAAGFICQIVFTNSVLSAMDTDEFEDAELDGFRQKIKNRTWIIFTALLSIIPLSITASFLLWYSELATLLSVLAVPAVFLIALIIVSVVVLKSKRFSFTETQKKNAKLKLKIISVAIAIAAVLAGTASVVNEYSTYVFSKGTTFNTAAEFVEFTENYQCCSEKLYGIVFSTESSHFVNANPSFSYCDNGELYDVQFSNSETRMPVKVYTKDDYIKGITGSTILTVICCVLGAADIAAAFVTYYKKKEK